MKEIACLAKLIREELCDAEKYADLSVKYSESDVELSTMYKNLAMAEIGHAEQEHTQAVRLIKKYKDSGRTVPDSMQAVWEWEHEQMIEREKEVKILLAMV